MNDTDYKTIIKNTLSRLAEIVRQREELDNEGAKLRQFLMATINMLPDEEREGFAQLLDTLARGLQASEEGLKEACLRVLRESKQWLTATQVRDRLRTSGFNFDDYQSNPLASISTTLRRMKPEEVETSEADGVAAYRFNYREHERQQKVKAGALGRIGRY